MKKTERRPIRPPKTKRVRVTEYEEPEEDRGGLDDEDLAGIDQDEESIRSILGQFGGSGEVEVKVYRVTATGKEYCYTDGPQITEEAIKQGPYGANGGRFLCHVMIDGQLRRVFPVNIAAPVRGGAAGEGGASDAIVRAIERLEARLNQPAQSEPMSQVLTAAVGLINSQAQKPVETPIEQVMKMAEFIVAMRGGGEADDSFAGILKGIAKEVAPAILPGLIQARNGGGGGQVQMSAEEEMIRSGILYLKKKCMMGTDPQLYIDFILDNADDERFGKLVQLAATQPFEIFAKLDPELANPPYLAYFKFIYDGLRSAISASDSVDVDSRGPGGDTNHVNQNGAASKGGKK